jgi:hypothetical protein
VGSVVDVSEIHAASIFMVEVNRVGECSCIYRSQIQQKHWGGKWIPARNLPVTSNDLSTSLHAAQPTAEEIKQHCGW